MDVAQFILQVSHQSSRVPVNPSKFALHKNIKVVAIGRDAVTYIHQYKLCLTIAISWAQMGTDGHSWAQMGTDEHI